MLKRSQKAENLSALTIIWSSLHGLQTLHRSLYLFSCAASEFFRFLVLTATRLYARIIQIHFDAGRNWPVN